MMSRYPNSFSLGGLLWPNIRFMPKQAWNLMMEFIVQISGHPKVGKKQCPVSWRYRQNQKAGISGRAF